jgi:mannose-1-phosphate guanylyltransferase
MRAVVLVGGFGTRLRPLTLTTPKPLLPVGHLPILEHVVGNLGRSGVTEAVLALGFRPDTFSDAYPDGTCAGVKLVYAVEPEPLDTAGAIAFAARHAGIDDTFLVANGDILTDLDVATLLAFHRSHGGEGTIHLTPVDDPSQFGVVPTDDDGLVQAFIEKPPPGQAPTNLINGGTYVLEASVLDRIETGTRVSIERVVFPAMVADRGLYAMATNDYWLDTGRPDLYLQANTDLLSGRRLRSCDALGVGVTVAPTASVEGSVIGSGSTIADGASVSGSVLQAGVSIGAGASIRSSCIGARAVIGAGADLHDAVIGDDVVVAPGERLHGVRVPEPT